MIIFMHILPFAMAHLPCCHPSDVHDTVSHPHSITLNMDGYAICQNKMQANITLDSHSKTFLQIRKITRKDLFIHFPEVNDIHVVYDIRRYGGVMDAVFRLSWHSTSSIQSELIIFLVMILCSHQGWMQIWNKVRKCFVEIVPSFCVGPK